MNKSLFTFTMKGLMLSDALRSFVATTGSHHAAAILFSPRQCLLGAIAYGVLTDSNGSPLDVTTVFEARVFSESSEFRWLNDPSPEQQHRAAIVTEQDLSSELHDWNFSQQDDVIDRLDQTYLLWGEGTGRPMNNGWSELATARIGALSIPIGNASRKDRVLLHSFEYLVESEHGNVIIFDERLSKLEVEHG
jgi:CRISPR-associated protein (TIGR03984 family)